ncbi:hypothetical protein ACGF13_21955 [Kitasatospora sp. NPDC048286]|uniref:hypothetical protein n=1 Tax=unclassified Kitasatospora TaxID=2633591 RepID=UPI00371659EA
MPTSAARPPVVRLRPVTPPAAQSIQRLPATSHPPQPSPAQPPTLASPAGAGWSAGPQPATASASVPVVSWSLPTGQAANAPAVRSTPSARAVPPTPGTARVLQRVAEQNGLAGIPLTAVPARTPTTVQRAGAAEPPAQAPGGPHAKPSADPSDLDELARRLVEPVGRLLRTELRRGRERSGKPYDMRR